MDKAQDIYKDTVVEEDAEADMDKELHDVRDTEKREDQAK